MSETADHRAAQEHLQPVDRLEFLVLIDNTTDPLSSVPSSVGLEWKNLIKAGMRQMSGGCLCCANHGLSIVVTAYRGEARHTVLFDAGPVDFAVGYNASRLGVTFSDVDAVMLSHGHWDHAGGLPAALDLITGLGADKRVCCYLHPGMFRQRALPQPSGLLPIQDIPTPEELAEHGAEPIVTRSPMAILDGSFFISGEIPRVTAYEKGLAGHMQRSLDGERWEPDPLIMDERFLAVHVRGKGLVVFSACSHAGIINVLRYARHAFPNVPLHAVAGGLHLSGPNEAIIAPTVADLSAFGLSAIMPGHCTGWRATCALERAFGEAVIPMAVGMSFAI